MNSEHQYALHASCHVIFSKSIANISIKYSSCWSANSWLLRWMSPSPRPWRRTTLNRDYDRFPIYRKKLRRTPAECLISSALLRQRWCRRIKATLTAVITGCTSLPTNYCVIFWLVCCSKQEPRAVPRLSFWEQTHKKKDKYEPPTEEERKAQRQQQYYYCYYYNCSY